MINLHPTFLEGEFFLWGEIPGESEASAVKIPRNKRKFARKSSSSKTSSLRRSY
jgi:hypothetical protein